MDKNAKIALAVIKKVCDRFPETQEFSNKIYVEECCKENVSVEEVFFNIIFPCDIMLLYGLLRNTLFSLVS